jgi:acyl-CoA thioester hydrolase
MPAELARIVHRSRVEWSDTDASGHYHNAAIGRFVEAAEAALVRDRGIVGYFGAAPRVRYEVDFAAPLWFGQEVTTVLAV